MTVLNLYILLSSPISAVTPCLQLHSFRLCYSTFLPTLGHPRWLCFLPALSLPLLFLSLFVRFFSQHHDTLEAKVPTLLSSPPTLCEVTPLLSPSKADPGPLPYVAVQSLQIRLKFFLHYIHLLLSRLNHFHLTIFARPSATLYVPTGSPSFFSPQFFYFDLSLSVSAFPDSIHSCIKCPSTRREYFLTGWNWGSNYTGCSRVWPRSPPRTRGAGKG